MPSDSVFECEFSGDANLVFTPAMQAGFDRNGYLLLKNLFSQDEIAKMRECIEQSEDIAANSFSRSDGRGQGFKMCLWMQPGDDVLGVATRCEKLLGTSEQLYGGDEMYHMSSKLIMKDAGVGGAFVWHQDYGYFYENGCITPDMISVWLPLDPVRKINGCLEVLPGSHKMGRQTHVGQGDLAQVDPSRQEAIEARYPKEYVEMDPGDVLLFDANLLHTSGKNESKDMRRWALVLVFNKVANAPFHNRFLPPPVRLQKEQNGALMSCNRFNSESNKEFISNKDDDSLKQMEEA